MSERKCSHCGLSEIECSSATILQLRSENADLKAKLAKREIELFGTEDVLKRTCQERPTKQEYESLKAKLAEAEKKLGEQIMGTGAWMHDWYELDNAARAKVEELERKLKEAEDLRGEPLSICRYCKTSVYAKQERATDGNSEDWYHPKCKIVAERDAERAKVETLQRLVVLREMEAADATDAMRQARIERESERALADRLAEVFGCDRCHGKGGWLKPCDDPQCGDSTWDHDCNMMYVKCLHPSGAEVLADHAKVRWK